MVLRDSTAVPMISIGRVWLGGDDEDGKPKYLSMLLDVTKVHADPQGESL